MVYMVDANLRSSTVRLVRLALAEEHRGKTEESGESSEVVVRNMGIFCNLLKSVILKKLSRFTISELDNMTLTSSVFLGEGHGSIEISEPPTEAQGRIIKSLVKVVFHQIETKGSSDDFEDLDEGHANLFLSLFIKKINCDLFEESSLLTLSNNSDLDLHARIRNIMTGSEDATENPPKPRFLSTICNDGSFIVHLYCCLEDVLQGNGSEVLLEEFDKIDLEDEGNDDDQDSDGPTLTSLSVCSGLISRLRISRQTLSQTRITLLPSQDFEGLWESLHFDERIKQRFYGYATVALKLASLSGKSVDDSYMDILANNKLLLVHGPPGTGKTTICKALCHKLSIRREFSQELCPIDAAHKGIVVEISCAQIFSRWFGESSKNLASIFNDVENLLKANQQHGSFVCLLIDEVEAIAFARSDLLNKNESTDGVRVVSTLLTQLDRLKKYNNLLVLATSNLIDSLDPAFVDRADGIFYIGNPSLNGVVKILCLGLRGLISKGLIAVVGDSTTILESQKYKQIITSIAEKCSDAQTSGRTLRKLPLICLSEHFRTIPVALDKFLLALAMSVTALSNQNHV